MTNDEIVEIMLDLSGYIADFCGCGLNVSVKDIGFFELENDFSVMLFMFSMIMLSLLARKYSADRGAYMEIRFNKLGVYFGFKFAIASQYRNIMLIDKRSDLQRFLEHIDKYNIIYEYYKDFEEFEVVIYPWVRVPTSPTLKKGKENLIYTDFDIN